jgi:hypothetical protein
MGMVSVLDVEEVGPEPLVNELGMDRALARLIVVRCAESAKEAAAAKQAAEKLKNAEARSARAKRSEAPAEAAEADPSEDAPSDIEIKSTDDDVAAEVDAATSTSTADAPEGSTESPADGEAAGT